MIDIKEVLNEEELLDVCLNLVSLEREQDEYFNGPAGGVITAYAVNNILKRQDEFTEEEICEEINRMIIEKTLYNLSKKGLVDVEFRDDDTYYSLSKEIRGKLE